MSLDNRDWYRDWWRKKTGYVERALFRVPSLRYTSAVTRKNPLHRSLAELMDGSFVDKRRGWHPVLQVVLFVIICLATFLILKLILLRS